MKKFVLFIAASVWALSAQAQQITGLAGWNIVLDPGHSYKENMGASGFSEAEKNVRVALLLRDLLLQNTDIDTVYLTRTDDFTEVGLSQRTDYANALGAAWFHSIHSDAAGSAETNFVSTWWGQYYDGREKIPNGGKAMAQIMVNKMSRALRITNFGAIGDCSFWGCTSGGPYYSVNRRSIMPAEISEAGHHSNPRHNQRQMNAQWHKLEAYTLYWSILRYHAIAIPPNHILTGTVMDSERATAINGAILNVGDFSYTTDSWESLFKKYSSDPEALRNGFYFLENLPAGPLQMIASAPEYYGDTLQVAAADTFVTFADVKLVWKRPPTIVLASPASGSDRQPAWGTLSFTFNRPVDRASVVAAFKIEPSAQGNFSWSDGDRRLLFKPDTLLYETEYTVTIAASATDRYHHPLDGNGDRIGGDDYILTFRTGPQDMSAPRIAAVYPPTSISALDTRPILNITYDEIIDSSSVNAELFTLQKSGTTNALPFTLAHYVIQGRSILSFAPNADLEPGQSYAILINPGLRDLIGNEETALKTYRFKSGAAFWRTWSIDNFESGLSSWWGPAQSGTTSGTIPDSTGCFSEGQIVNPLSGSTLSMALRYGWDPSASDWILREYLGGGAAKAVTFDQSKRLQVYVFGDNSGTLFRFAVDDRVPVAAAGNHEVSPWYKVNWYGWRLISWEMSTETPGSWLGDGQLDGTLAFDSIQLGREAGSALSGTLYFDDLRIAEFSAVGVEERDSALPQEFELLQNFPNPFNPTTTIRFRLPVSGQDAVLRIYDLLGQPVRTLFDGRQNAGEHAVTWNGCDDSGRSVASGIYIYQIKTPSHLAARRMIYIK